MKKINYFILIFSVSFFSCMMQAQADVKSDSLTVLKAKEALLKESTILNKLKVKEAKLVLEATKLEKKIADLNKDASKSAGESKSYAAKLSANPRDEKLSRKAKKASDTSYADAKKAQKISDQLKSNQKEIKSLNDAIEKQREKIKQMDLQLKFSTN